MRQKRHRKYIDPEIKRAYENAFGNPESLFEKFIEILATNLLQEYFNRLGNAAKNKDKN